MKLLLFLFLALLILKPAFADEVIGTAFMTCDEAADRVLIRLGYSHQEPVSIDGANTSIVPYDLARGLDKKVPVKSCTLSDGRKFEVNASEGQVFAYGQNGGDPVKYFSLAMNGKPVFYKMGWGGQGSEDAPFAVLVVNHDKLIACQTSDQKVHWYKNEEIDEHACEDLSKRLAGDLTAQEQAAVTEDNKKLEYVPLSMNKKICGSFNLWDFSDEDGADDGFEALGSTPQGNLFVKNINIENTDKTFTVYQLASWNHYFDGSYIVYFPKDSHEKESFLGCIKDGQCPVLPADLQKKGGSNPMQDVDKAINVIPLLWPDAKVISGASANQKSYWTPRYVHIFLRELEGKAYIFLRPVNVGAFPRAIVFMPKENGKLEKYCTYK